MVVKLIILGLLLVSSVCSSQDFASSIDQIISKHYNKAVQNGFVNAESLTIGASKHSFAYDCVHDKLYHSNSNRSVGATVKRIIMERKRNGLAEETVHASQKRATFGPIRFFSNLDYLQAQQNDPRACYTVGQTVMNNDGSGDVSYKCLAEDILTTQLRSTIRTTFIPALLEVFSTLLNVVVTQGNLKLDQAFYNEYPTCADDFPIPQSYVTQGLPNTDYVVFVTARPMEEKGVVAYAGACNIQVEGRNLGRPLAGSINFIPRWFQEFASGTYTEFDFNKAIKVGIHEMTHALGFDSSLYEYFKDQTTGTYYTTDVAFSETVAGVSAAGNSFSVEIQKLRSPRALDYARQHYSCPTLNGIELEDFGGSGTAGSHWERRVAGDEYMTGYTNPAMPISGLTLSLFEDMGYYTANIDKAEFWSWGKGAGCDFLQKRCEESWPAAGYWCTQDSSGCSPDRTTKGVCAVFQYGEDLPAYYQHFSNPTVGGGEDVDGCAYITTVGNQGYYCNDPNYANEADTTIGEEIGKSNSICFDVKKGSTNAASCYQYKCLNSSQLQVYVSGSWLNCPTNGGSLDASSVVPNLSVTCPVGAFVCGNVVPEIVTNTDNGPSVIVITTGVSSTGRTTSTTSTASTTSGNSDTEDNDSSSSASMIRIVTLNALLYVVLYVCL